MRKPGYSPLSIPSQPKETPNAEAFSHMDRLAAAPRGRKTMWQLVVHLLMQDFILDIHQLLLDLCLFWNVYLVVDGCFIYCNPFLDRDGHFHIFSPFFDNMVSGLDCVSNVVLWIPFWHVEPLEVEVWPKEKPTPCSVIRTHGMRMLFRIRFDGYSWDHEMLFQQFVLWVDPFRECMWIVHDTTVYTRYPCEFLEHFY